MLRIGLSLSFCISDLLKKGEGAQGYDAIVSCTNFDTPEQAFDAYYQNYWCDHEPEMVKALLHDIWGSLVQPRRMGGFMKSYSHNISAGHWVEVESMLELWKLLDDRNEAAGWPTRYWSSGS